MVVDGDRQHLLGAILANDVIVQNLFDFNGFRELVAGLFGAILELFADDVVAEFNALVADEHRGSRDEFADLVLAFAAERTVKKLAVVGAATAGFVTHGSTYSRFSSDLSTRPYSMAASTPMKLSRSVSC